MHRRNFATNVGTAGVCMRAVLQGMNSPTGEGPLKAVAPAKRPRRTTARMAETRTIGQRGALCPFYEWFLGCPSISRLRPSSGVASCSSWKRYSGGCVLKPSFTLKEATPEGAVVLLDASPRSGHGRPVRVRFRHLRRAIGRRCVECLGLLPDSAAKNVFRPPFRASACLPQATAKGGAVRLIPSIPCASQCHVLRTDGPSRRVLHLHARVRPHAPVRRFLTAAPYEPAALAFANPPMSVFRSRLLHALPSARSWRQQTRSLSNLRLAKGSISSLYQAKGRTEESLNEIATRLATKKFELDVPLMLEMEAERKKAQALASELQAERNSKSKQIGMMKGKGEDTTAIMAEVDGLKAKTTEAEEKMKAVDAKLEQYLLQIPNAPVSWRWRS